MTIWIDTLSDSLSTLSFFPHWLSKMTIIVDLIFNTEVNRKSKSVNRTSQNSTELFELWLYLK